MNTVVHFGLLFFGLAFISWVRWGRSRWLDDRPHEHHPDNHPDKDRL